MLREKRLIGDLAITKKLAAVFIIIMMAASVTACSNDSSEKADSKGSTNGAGSSGLKIAQKEITETAKFYGYNAGDTYMEVVAVKAKDGTIKTALNTCQVCYSSGRGYYKQNGDTLVCQNCGNVFDIAYIGNAKNGCNPVPIDTTAKKEDGDNIIISKDFLENSKSLFANWEK